MKAIEGGTVSTPQGFVAAGIHAGIKADGDLKDLALVLSDRVASAAAVYTANQVQAAPIQVDREHLADNQARGVILNSGNANACTGRRGLEDARRMCGLAAQELDLAAEDILVCSTGVIGVELPMAVIEAAVADLAAAVTADGGAAAAEAIMTTYTVPKSWAVEVELSQGTVRVGGMAKGAGMIAPNMATMLSVITTDAQVEAGFLRQVLSQAVKRSFNGITVDGDMSTNDTVIALANGAAGPQVVAGSADAVAFGEAFEEVCRQLARMIARDGEGATKLITIRVTGAVNEADGRQVGLAVANSNLVKTAVFGRDPNWGRILCAVGYAGVPIEPEQVRVSLCNTPIYAEGGGLAFDHGALVEAMGAADIPIEIDLAQGPAAAEIYTCDLSYDYVRINAEYTT